MESIFKQVEPFTKKELEFMLNDYKNLLFQYENKLKNFENRINNIKNNTTDRQDLEKALRLISIFMEKSINIEDYIEEKEKNLKLIKQEYELIDNIIEKLTIIIDVLS